MLSKHDANIYLRIFDPCLLKKKEANALDLDDFRQLTLYFGLSTLINSY